METSDSIIKRVAVGTVIHVVFFFSLLILSNDCQVVTSRVQWRK